MLLTGSRSSLIIAKSRLIIMLIRTCVQAADWCQLLVMWLNELGEIYDAVCSFELLFTECWMRETTKVNSASIICCQFFNCQRFL